MKPDLALQFLRQHQPLPPTRGVGDEVLQTFDELTKLLNTVPRAPEAKIPGPAAEADIKRLEDCLGYPLPSSLKTWLHISNGPCVGPGGIIGVGDLPEHLSIEAWMSLHPSWKDRGWIPVAGDGSGNFFLLLAYPDSNGRHPVVFVESIGSEDRPTYVAASDLPHFINSLLRRELGQSGWPFSQEEVVAYDPAILEVRCAPLPWEA